MKTKFKRMKFTDSTFAQCAIAATLSAGSLTLFIPAAIADAPGISIGNYQLLKSNTVQECVKSAQSVMKQEGLQHIEVTVNDVFGVRKNTSAEMFCLSDGKSLILVTTSLNNQERVALFQALQKRLVSSH